MTEYKSKYFTIVSSVKEGKDTITLIDVRKEDLQLIKDPIGTSRFFCTVKKVDSAIDGFQRYKIITDDCVNFSLNDLEKYMMGRSFDAIDHLERIKELPYLKNLADRILKKEVFEDAEYPELVKKIEDYMFEDSPYYRDDKHYNYVNDILYYYGVFGLVSHIIDLDMIGMDNYFWMQKHDYRDGAKILNEHPDTVIHENSLEYFKSFGERSLIPQFAVKTNGFNQDFRGKKAGEAYSSVNITKHTGVEIYEVNINGNDDSSYGREFDSLHKAKKCAEGLKRVSTILLQGHLAKSGFKFTN